MGERRDRVRLAWNVLRGRPTMYRIRISEDGVGPAVGLNGTSGLGDKALIYHNEFYGHFQADTLRRVRADTWTWAEWEGENDG